MTHKGKKIIQLQLSLLPYKSMPSYICIIYRNVALPYFRACLSVPPSLSSWGICQRARSPKSPRSHPGKMHGRWSAPDAQPPLGLRYPSFSGSIQTKFEKCYRFGPWYLLCVCVYCTIKVKFVTGTHLSSCSLSCFVLNSPSISH